MANALQFRLNDKQIELKRFDPTRTLLDFIREDMRLTGTKEGCNEGDCGACTIAVGERVAGEIKYQPINACIQLLGMVHGKHVVTIEYLNAVGELHLVQNEMAVQHGSQCGYCTPGIVMSLYCLSEEGQGKPDRQTVNEQLAGNLCRCTGYRPIVDAAMASCFNGDRKQLQPEMNFDSGDLFVGSENEFFAAPTTLNLALEIKKKYPNCTLVAGATDVGLWVTKRLDRLPQILYLGRIAEINTIEEDGVNLMIGAGVRYSDAFEALSEIDPDIMELLLRLGSKQVRASGTVGGNIMNGSPIGDTPPLLIALGAEIQLGSPETTRSLLLEDFFIEYGKQDKRDGEILTKITVPKLKSNEHLRVTKISKRFDQDISAVLGAFKIQLDGPMIMKAQIAFGGMAGIPARAKNIELALIGLSIKDTALWQAALDAMEIDFKPMSDMRASAVYRMQVAKNILRKALLEIGGSNSTTTRVKGLRPDDLTAGSAV